MRSRAKSLFCCAFFWWYFAAPPFWTKAMRRARSASFVMIND